MEALNLDRAMTDFPNRIIHILRSCPNGLTSKDIAERRLGTTRRDVSSRLSKLAAYGIIGRVRGTLAEHGTKGAIYRAPSNAAQDGPI
jgi:CRP-like cAMP-binding protein